MSDDRAGGPVPALERDGSAAVERPIHVMHVIETLDVGGAENVVANIAGGLSGAFRASICCLKRSGPVAARLPAGVRVHALGQRDGNDPRTPFRLAALLRSEGADVVHSHGWGTFCESAAAAVLAGTPARVHMAHGLHQGYAPDDGARRFKEPLRRAAERAFARAVDRIIAVSDRVKEDIVGVIGIPEAKVTVIRNGVAPAEGASDPGGPRREMGWRPADLVVCAVGRLAAVKNYQGLLEAAARLADLRPRLKVAIVGDGPERARLEQRVLRLGLRENVFFAGERRDVRAWLACADVFALPSDYEGISVALLEAMSAGVPAVATRVGGNAEVVRHGENGLLVPPRDPAALAGALRELLLDAALRRAMGQAASRTVRERFDLARTVRKYEELYLSLLRPAPLADHPSVFSYVRNRGNI